MKIDENREKLVGILAAILEVPKEEVGNHVLVVLSKSDRKCNKHDCGGFHHLNVLSSIREASSTLHLLERASDSLLPGVAEEMAEAIEVAPVIQIDAWLHGNWPGEGPGA